MIRSFRDKRTAAVFSGRSVKGLPPDLQRRAKAKMDLLDAAAALADLRVPPGNRLEALKGERTGQFSVRVNDQWRLCFAWRQGDVFDVEIVDYHRG